MEPTKFKEQNTTILKPPNMTEEECGDLPAFKTGDGQIISCWKVGWLQRLKCVFTGRIWVGVHVAQNIPPMWLSVHNPFKKNVKGGEATER